MLAIDHVIVPVVDLARAASEIESRYGLASIEGGRHPAWGTANRIVPLGDSYVELVAVVDPETAAGTTFGGWIASAEPGRPLGWVVRTNDIDGIERRLALTGVPGLRAAPGGAQITWRSAGVDVAMREPALPFFIEWGVGVPLPGAVLIRHPRGPARLKLLSLSEEPGRLASWLGDHGLPLVVAGGPSKVLGVVIAQGDGDYPLLLEDAV